MSVSDPRHVVITGASSGIGAALALAYASKNRVLSLAGQNVARLNKVAEAAEKCGAEVTIKPLNVCDSEAMAQWIKSCWQLCPIDLLIANAGISAGTGTGIETEQQARQIFAVNVEGVLNTVLPVLPEMQERGTGQIAIMSSLAGLIALPGAPSYCASKAAVRAYGLALRRKMASHGIAVNVICPGFVETPLTAVNPFPMPFLMRADQAANRIKNGLAQNCGQIAFPWQMRMAIGFANIFPSAVIDKFLSRLPDKPAL